MSKPDDNPFLEPQSIDSARDARPRGEAGVVGTIIGVIVMLIIAVVMFFVTFLFTCIGAFAIHKPETQLGEFFVCAGAGIAAVVSVPLSIRSIRRISGAIRRR